MFPSTPVILVLGLTVATCVIAYWADNLGKKLGKKRISLFGLRPRQTATLISMATSVCIMLLTLGVLLILSGSLRNALLRYDEVRDQANKYRKLLVEVRKSVTVAETRAVRARAELGETESQLHRETRNTLKARQLTAVARQDYERAQQSLKAARFAEASARRGQADARRGEANARSGEANALQGERRAMSAQRVAQSRAVQLRALLTTSKAVLETTRAELDANAAALSSQRAQLASVRALSTRLIASNGRLIKSGAELNARIEALDERRTALEREGAVLRERNELAQRSFNELTAIAANYGGVVGLLGAGKIAVSLGQALGEATLPAASEPARVRAALRSLLEGGSEEAERLGGQPYVAEDGGPSRALHLAPRPVGERGEGELLGEAAQIEQLANYLATFKLPVSLRVVAARNYAEGETQFEARLVIVPIKRAFVAGETLTSSTVDGNGTDAQIFNALLALVNAGEAVARSRGVSPITSAQNPDFYAAGTNERIFDALRDVQMQARQVRVRLIAAEDASTTENLRVRFIIERLAT